MPAQHIVEVGDTLESIAAKHYGDPNMAFRVYRANQQRIRNREHLNSGELLTIPGKTIS